MADPPLISIIIPVYNAAATLETCLHSACQQQDVRLELLCIDDGSQDASGTILDTWAARDPRLRVIHQTNAGVSAARNRALATLKGEYFTLLDADDQLEPGFLSTLLHALQQHQADGVICGLTRIQGRTRIPQPACDHPHLATLDAPGIAALPPTCCSRLYSTDLLHRSHAHYPEGVRYGEDTAFNYAINAAATRILLHPATGYLYTDNPTSASHTAISTKVTGMVDALHCLQQILAQQGMDERRQQLLAHYASHALRRIRSMAPHSSQATCAAHVRSILQQAGVGPAQLSTLRPKDAATLQRILQGSTGLSLGYYWRRLTRRLRGK